MKGTQNKTIISQKAFIIHIYGLHHYKGKLSPSHHSVQVIPNMVAQMWRCMRVSREWKKKYRVFLPDDINRISVWQLLSKIYIFYFEYLSSGHPIYFNEIHILMFVPYGDNYYAAINSHVRSWCQLPSEHSYFAAPSLHCPLVEICIELTSARLQV
jgi:hypothetical protein